MSRARDQYGYLEGGSDADAVRFTSSNDRLCDYAHMDVDAGLHKHVIDRDGQGDPSNVWHCLACGRTWEKVSE